MWKGILPQSQRLREDYTGRCPDSRALTSRSDRVNVLSATKVVVISYRNHKKLICSLMFWNIFSSFFFLSPFFVYPIHTENATSGKDTGANQNQFSPFQMRKLRTWSPLNSFVQWLSAFCPWSYTLSYTFSSCSQFFPVFLFPSPILLSIIYSISSFPPSICLLSFYISILSPALSIFPKEHIHICWSPLSKNT